MFSGLAPFGDEIKTGTLAAGRRGEQFAGDAIVTGILGNPPPEPLFEGRRALELQLRVGTHFGNDGRPQDAREMRRIRRAFQQTIDNGAALVGPRLFEEHLHFGAGRDAADNIQIGPPQEFGVVRGGSRFELLFTPASGDFVIDGRRQMGHRIDSGRKVPG